MTQNTIHTSSLELKIRIYCLVTYSVLQRFGNLLYDNDILFCDYLYETRGVVVAIALNIAASVRRVVIPIVTRPGTWSRGINKENHPIMTNKPDGRYVRKRW